MWVVYIVASAALVLALVTDDAIRPFIKLTEPDYYAMLIAIAAAIFLGGVLTWLIAG
jgi:membrane protein YqaA with SNARE-associated domain